MTKTKEEPLSLTSEETGHQEDRQWEHHSSRSSGELSGPKHLDISFAMAAGRLLNKAQSLREPQYSQ
jgi:hypothetical protein